MVHSTILNKTYPGQPRQKPKPAAKTLERDNGITLKYYSAWQFPYVVQPIDCRWKAEFTHEEDARLFFNIKCGGF